MAHRQAVASRLRAKLHSLAFQLRNFAAYAPVSYLIGFVARTSVAGGLVMRSVYLRVQVALVCLVAIGTVNAISATAAAARPAIVTQNGPLKVIETPTTDEYLGIPYAVPPVGNLRRILRSMRKAISTATTG
jgi:hypothetical protein